MRFIYVIECIFIELSYIYPNNRKDLFLLSVEAAVNSVDRVVGWFGLAVICAAIFIAIYKIRKMKNAKIVTIMGIILCVAIIIGQIVLVEIRFRQLGL